MTEDKQSLSSVLGKGNAIVSGRTELPVHLRPKSERKAFLRHLDQIWGRRRFDDLEEKKPEQLLERLRFCQFRRHGKRRKEFARLTDLIERIEADDFGEHTNWLFEQEMRRSLAERLLRLHTLRTMVALGGEAGDVAKRMLEGWEVIDRAGIGTKSEIAFWVKRYPHSCKLLLQKIAQSSSGLSLFGHVYENLANALDGIGEKVAAVSIEDDDLVEPDNPNIRFYLAYEAWAAPYRENGGRAPKKRYLATMDDWSKEFQKLFEEEAKVIDDDKKILDLILDRGGKAYRRMQQADKSLSA